MLGTDRRALLTWPVIVASRVLPVALLAVAVCVPAGFWSQLPPSRPGPLLVAVLPAVIGIFVTVPQAVHPVVMDPEPFLGPLQSGYLPGLTVGFVRSRLGQLPLGIFFLSEAAARTVGLTVVNAGAGAGRWQVPFLVFIAGTAGSIAVAAAAGVTLRRFGRPKPSVIAVTSRERPKPVSPAPTQVQRGRTHG